MGLSPQPGNCNAVLDYDGVRYYCDAKPGSTHDDHYVFDSLPGSNELVPTWRNEAAGNKGTVDIHEVSRDTQRRSVGRSSVTSSTAAERAPEAGKAGTAMEPEFVDEVLSATRWMLRFQHQRITVDEIWDWADSNEVYTEHPKGIRTRIIDALIREGSMEPVSDDDPDALRTSKRTNASRQVRVYRSLIYRGGDSPA